MNPSADASSTATRNTDVKSLGNFYQAPVSQDDHLPSQQWLLDKQDLIRERQSDLKVLSEEDYQKIMIFFANFIQALGEQLKVRQQVIATATVYFKRFYARNSLKSIDPWLMAPTCIFLASKVEEFGVISNSRLVSTCQTVVKNKFSHAYPQEYPYRISNVLECEFYLLEMMVLQANCINPDMQSHSAPEDLGLSSLFGVISRTSSTDLDIFVHYADCCLVVYHPYRPLTQFVSDFSNTDDTIMALAWRIVNDSLRTDVCLLYPPYMIALAALHIACVIQQKDVKTWLAELTLDMDKILEITKQILKLYELWKNYDEKKEIAAVLNNMPKARTSPTPPPNQGPNDGAQTSQTSQST